MSSLFVHNPASLAWQEIVSLTDRPSSVLREQWGVESSGSGSPVERHLHGHGKTLTLTLEAERNEITGYIKEFARVRRFRIGSDESSQPLLTEQGGDTKTVAAILEDLVSWLKGRVDNRT